jgi:putative transcriptional regulator
MTPDELKAIRESLNLTQSELASLIGASVHALRKWEQGQRKVSGVATVAIKKLMEEKP